MRHHLVFCALLGAFSLAGGQAKPAQPPAKTQPAPQAKPSATPMDADARNAAEATLTARATIDWDKSTTAGAKAEVLLIQKGQDANGKPLVQYHVKVTGAPHNKLYSLVAWPITIAQPATMMEGLAIAADGTVGCPPNSTLSCSKYFKGAELRLNYTPGIGEIFRHALVSQDHQTRVFFTIIPAPMVEKSNACSMEVIRLSPRFELAVIRGKGFTPGEQVAFHTQSYQDVHDTQPKTDANGEFWAVITPFVKGRVMGTTEVSARASKCAPALSFEWGSQ